jgi:cystathionine beta-synthase
MSIVNIDILVIVPPAEPPYRFIARARRVVRLPAAEVQPATLGELRARIPRLVAVYGGTEAVAVASSIHNTGIPVVLIATDPSVVAPPGIEVQPANDPGPPMETTESILDLIGNTPLLALHRTGRALSCHLLAKLEYLNPGGSVKDRPALAMVAAAERDGLLVSGGTIVEPTSGNTGVGLAIVAAQRGYRCIFTMPDKIAAEKIQLLRAYGAEVVICPTAVAPEHPESYYSVADKLTASTPKAFQPNQYRNPENPASHYRSTGPEIWRQTAQRVTHFVASVGTGGTISGTGRYLKEQNPAIQVIGADPVGSVYSGGGGRPYLVEGIGEDFWPATYDPSVVDRVIAVSDADSFAMARRVTREEGLHVGGSCGTVIWAALEVGRELGPDAVVVVLLPDSGRGYLSKLYNDAWMADHGFLQASGPTVGKVLATKTSALPPLIHVHPDETVRAAIAVLREYEVSQMPVVKAEPPLSLAEVVGSVTDRALLEQVLRDPTTIELPVSSLMDPPLPTVGTGETIDQVAAALHESPAVLALDQGHPVGILTRSDLLTYLSRQR